MSREHLKSIPTYRAMDGITIAFHPVKGFPGFSHRVVVNGVLTQWLLCNEAQPSAKSALFFVEKERTRQKDA